MIGDANGQPQTFKLDVSDTVSLKILAVLQEAKDKGIETRVIQILKTIFRRLRTDPLEVGELLRQYPILNLHVHVAVIHPVVVHFGINLVHKFVVIQRVFLVSSGPEQ
jgi:hypothetical protein